MRQPETPYERATVAAIVRFLEEQGARVVAKRSSVDPPDYDLAIDDERFALEVTTLFERIHDGQPVMLMHDHFGRLIARAEQRARDVGVLVGTWLVQHPGAPIGDWSRTARVIESAIVDAVARAGAAGRVIELAWSERDDVGVDRQVWVMRNRESPDALVAAGATWTSVGPGQRQAQASGIMRDALAGKAAKMRRDGRRWAIALLDQIIAIEPEIYARAFDELATDFGFAAVFLVHGTGDVVPLRWSAAGGARP